MPNGLLSVETKPQAGCRRGTEQPRTCHPEVADTGVGLGHGLA